MKNIILGTAGHVDHGKTSLIKALTGFDCDTHQEEKRRGITINLGFTHLDLDDGQRIGVIDVPGHRDFIHTMVGGAAGIDLALLVIAADSGVMPQTREHLHIMNVLGIATGIIALNKADLVEPDMLELVTEEIRQFTRHTFLDSAPIIPVSAKTGQGLDQLKAAIATATRQIPDRPQGHGFRLYIDRIFNVSGFGTVVTGTVLSGSLKTGDTVYLLPTGRELRVRRLEHHGTHADQIQTGERASLNLIGLDKSDYKTGMQLSDRPLLTTRRIDVQLHLFSEASPLPLWNQGIFHCGTFTCQARVHLLDTDQLDAGQTAIAQIHLEQASVFQPGDHIVLRNSSSERTLGGGPVIDAFPLHHRRRPPKLIDQLHRLAQGQLPELILASITRSITPVSRQELALRLNLTDTALQPILGSLDTASVIAYQDHDLQIFVGKKINVRIRNLILKLLKSQHKRNPFSRTGLTLQELIGQLKLPTSEGNLLFLSRLIEQLDAEKLIRAVDSTWALTDHQVALHQDIDRHITLILDYIRQCGMQTPLPNQLADLCRKHRIEDPEFKQIMRYLIENKKIYFIEDQYLFASVVDECRQKLLQALSQTPQGLTVAQFRDLVNGNRKICLLLLGRFDNEGITSRNGDYRTITAKGQEALGS